MTPFQRATVPEAERNASFQASVKAWENGDPILRDATQGMNRQQAMHYIAQVLKKSMECEIWANDLYQVAVYDDGPIAHLSIKRNDREPIRDWRHLQQIKNELVGPECEGVELYPAESRLVDTANQFHLWVFKDPEYRIPIGFHEGRKVGDFGNIHRSKQRPFGQE